MENLGYSEGRPPDGIIPDILMADDVTSEIRDVPVGEEQSGAPRQGDTATGTGDMSTDHVDIETCDRPPQPETHGISWQTQEENSAMSVKSEGESEEEDEKEPLPYDLLQGCRILTEIMSDANKSINWPFMGPVDAEGMGLSDYYERVKKPIWLEKMMDKFETRQYTTITEFAQDFRLMLENCYRYNGPDHYVSKRGQKLETVFEQKLSLLSRDLREKTSIAATSGKPIEDKILTGTRRRKVLTPHDSTDLLNQLRLEEKEREREARRQQVEERRNQQQAFIQDLQDWEDALLGPGGRDYLRAMWELPQIGHFIFLTADVLHLDEVMQWELERSFWMPRQSMVLHPIMTSLLSTPYQRTRLESKPPMPYNVWEEKLRTRVRGWYKVFTENNQDAKKTHLKLGLEEMFFKVLGLTNPLEKRKFHELTFYQRIWIVKGLCDWCLETQDSIRDAIEQQAVSEQRDYSLGTDADGNSYIHFPQFCGQDLRIYRIQPPPASLNEGTPNKTVRAKQTKDQKKAKSPRKKKHGRTKKTRGNTRSETISRKTVVSESDGSSSDSGINESETSDSDVGPRAKLRRRSPPSTRRPPPATTTGSSPAVTPTKGRLSRTSTAAREWLPRDCPPLVEAPTRRRGSQRLANTSGSSTPTVALTPGGSRESTPAPTITTPSTGRRSRSSTPSVDMPFSCASSPKKQKPSTTRQSASQRQRHQRQRRKGRHRRVGAARVNHSEDNYDGENGEEGDEEEEEEEEEDEGEEEEGEEGEMESSMREESRERMDITAKGAVDPSRRDTGRSSVDISVKDSSSRSSISSGGEGDVAKCDPSLKRRAPPCGMDYVNGFLPADGGGDSRTGTPASSCCADDLPQLSLPGGHSAGDTKTSCDTDVGDGTTQWGAGHALGTACPGDSKPTLGNSDTPPTSETKVQKDSSSTGNGLPNGEVDSSSVCGAVGVLDGVVKHEITEDGATVNRPTPTVKAGPEEEVSIKQEPVDAAEATEESTTIKSEPLQEDQKGDERADVKTEHDQESLKPSEDLKTEDSIKSEVEAAEQEVEPEIKFPEVGPFMLVADTVEMLRELVLQFAEPEPIVEIKGKKEKVIRPPPRKRCVSELYERLEYLLKELEPWESKLMAANKKARIKMRKEFDNFVEEPEQQEVEDVWESEESQSEESENEDSEENEGEEGDDMNREEEPPTDNVAGSAMSSSVATTPTTGTKGTPRTPKKATPVDTDSNASGQSTADDTERSSYGRIRKRKVLTSLGDEPPGGKKKRTKDKESSPSATPTILQSSRSRGRPAPSMADSLRTALSRAKPVSTASALPPGMQLLNIGGQNVLLNTNTKPPVILQTSAPLNLNNLTLLAQLSAQAAAGNSLGTKVVVASSSPTVVPKASTVTATTAAAAATATATVASTANQLPQQVIRTLLASGHAPQHPMTRQPKPSQSQAKGAVVASLPRVQSSSMQQINLIPNHIVYSTTPAVAPSNASALSSPSVLQQQQVVGHQQVVGQSLLQQQQQQQHPAMASPAGAGSTARPQFYKYNDLSQMRATIRQQLVRTSNGMRTKATVSNVPPPRTSAVTNLVQAGLLPQAPRMTAAMLQPPSPAYRSVETVPTTTALGLSAMPAMGAVKGTLALKVGSSSGDAVVSTPAVGTTVVASVETKKSSILSQVLTAPTETTPTVGASANIQTVAALQPQPQPSLPQLVITSTHSSTTSPHTDSPSTTVRNTLTILTSPTKSPPGGAQQGQLSPEFRHAVKMGIVNEGNIGSLINANPGLVKALNNSMRPKYASNVTVKSLLESRALRQKAQLHKDGEAVTSMATISPAVISPEKNVTKTQVQVPSLALKDGSLPVQIHSIQSDKLTEQAAKAVVPVSISSQHTTKGGQLPTIKTIPVHMQNVQAPGARLPPPTSSPALQLPRARIPIQIQAVKTSQGTTFLRTQTGQIALKSGLPRLQTITTTANSVTTSQCAPKVQAQPAKPRAGQALTMQTAQPTLLQLATPSQIVQPQVTEAALTGLPTKVETAAALGFALPAAAAAAAAAAAPKVSTASSKLDEALRSVVTTVHTSIPTAQIKISSPFAAPGHQPVRQVSMTTSTMQTPIPAVAPQGPVSKASSTPVSGVPSSSASAGASVPQARMLMQGATSPVMPAVMPVSGSAGQRNVVLRVVPQQLMTSHGVINMVVPQQVLQQAMKVDGNNSGKLMLQTGKTGVQLIQTVSQENASPIAGTGQPVSAGQGQTVLQTVPMAGPEPNTGTPAVQSAMLVKPNVFSKGPTATIPVQPTKSQPSPVQQKPKLHFVTVPQQVVATDGAQLAPAKVLASVDGGGQKIATTPSIPPTELLVTRGKDLPEVSITQPNNSVKVTTALPAGLVAQLSGLKSPGGSLGTTSAKGQQLAVHRNIKILSPQLTLSSAGLVHVPMTSAQTAGVSSLTLQPQPSQKTNATPPGVSGNSLKQGMMVTRNHDAAPTVVSTAVMEQSAIAEATSSLDLLAAASMLQEAKAVSNCSEATPPTALTPGSAGPSCPSAAILAVAKQHKINEQPRQQQQQQPAVVGAQAVAGTPTGIQQLRPRTISSGVVKKETASTLNTLQQQQALVLEKQIQLQHQMIEEQQKHQKLINQIGMQKQKQQQLQTPASPAATLLAAPETKQQVMQPAANIIKPTTPVKPLAQSANTTATVSKTTATEGTVQMASVMATVGGRMVQLRFAVPAGANVQQLLQTAQFQQQLAALKVTAIHGITTTSSVAATTTATVTASASLAASTNVQSALPSSVTAHKPVCSAINTKAQPVVVQRAVALANPAKVAGLSTSVAQAQLNSPLTAATTAASVFNLPQANAVGGGSQTGNKITFLVNINGQLMQAHGVSLGGTGLRPHDQTVAVVSGSSKGAATAAPQTGVKAIQAAIPVGGKVPQSLASPPPPPPVCLSQQTVMSQPWQLSTPTKVPLSSPNLVTLSPQQQQQQQQQQLVIIGARSSPTASNQSQALDAAGVQAHAAKTNLLTQFASSVAGNPQVVSPPPNSSLVLGKPVVVSNASLVTLATASKTL